MSFDLAGGDLGWKMVNMWDKSWRNGGTHIFLAVKKRFTNTSEQGTECAGDQNKFVGVQIGKVFLLLLIA